MPKAINNADAARQLVSQFDLKGRVTLNLDETVVPIVIVGDLTAAAGGRRCGRNFDQGAGGAGQFSHSGVSAVPGVDLKVHGFMISNLGAAGRAYRINTFSAADFATIGVATNNLFAFDSPSDELLASEVWNGLDVSSTLGNPISRVVLLEDVSIFVPLDFTLFGSNLVNVAGIGVSMQNANEALTLSSICTEFVVQ